MDPDADVREAEIARYSVGDDAVCAFPMFFCYADRLNLALISSRFKSYDKVLSYTLFALFRAGNIEDVVKLCRDVHQPWHAASIRGSLLFS